MQNVALPTQGPCSMEERRKLVRRTDDRMWRAEYDKLRADSGGGETRKLLRRAVRHHCTVSIARTGGIQSTLGDVWSPVQFAIKGRVLDLSESGCSVFTRDAFEAGQQVRVMLELEVQGSVHCNGTARWSKSIPEKGGFATGFHFTGLASDNVLRLESFLKRMDATAGL